MNLFKIRIGISQGTKDAAKKVANSVAKLNPIEVRKMTDEEIAAEELKNAQEQLDNLVKRAREAGLDVQSAD